MKVTAYKETTSRDVRIDPMHWGTKTTERTVTIGNDGTRTTVERSEVTTSHVKDCSCSGYCSCWGS